MSILLINVKTGIKYKTTAWNYYKIGEKVTYRDREYTVFDVTVLNNAFGLYIQIFIDPI